VVKRSKGGPGKEGLLEQSGGEEKGGEGTSWARSKVGKQSENFWFTGRTEPLPVWFNSMGREAVPRGSVVIRGTFCLGTCQQNFWVGKGRRNNRVSTDLENMGTQGCGPKERVGSYGGNYLRGEGNEN